MSYKQKTFPEFVGATFFRTLGHEGNLFAIIRDSIRSMFEQLGGAAVGVDIKLPLSVSDSKIAIKTAMLGIIYPKVKSESEFDDFCLFMMAIEMVRHQTFDERTILETFNEFAIYPFDYSGSPEITANNVINRVTWPVFAPIVQGLATLRDKASVVMENAPDVIASALKQNIRMLSQTYGKCATTKFCTVESSEQDIQDVYQCRVAAFGLIWHYQMMLAFQDVLTNQSVTAVVFSVIGG